jgi:dTDP-glucose 4,6-dehydratase
VRTLITGGTGFVGKALLEATRYSDRLGTITIAARNKPRVTTPGITFCHWNLLEKSPLEANFDLLIHAATPAMIEINNPVNTYETSLLTMTNLISFAEQHKSAPRILFASSGAVYGDMSGDSPRIEERWKPVDNPESLGEYGRGKLMAEGMLRDACRAGKCESIVARLFAFSGRFLPLDRHFAIGNFVGQAVLDRHITVRGDGQSIRSYLDSADMASWLITAALEGTSDVPLHIGSEKSINIAKLAALVAEIAGELFNQQIQVEVMGQKSAIDGVRSYVPSTELTRQTLLVRETVNLEDSISNMLKP